MCVENRMTVEIKDLFFAADLPKRFIETVTSVRHIKKRSITNPNNKNP
jgi:hypothetical protein